MANETANTSVELCPPPSHSVACRARPLPLARVALFLVALFLPLHQRAFPKVSPPHGDAFVATQHRASNETISRRTRRIDDCMRVTSLHSLRGRLCPSGNRVFAAHDRQRPIAADIAPDFGSGAMTGHGQEWRMTATQFRHSMEPPWVAAAGQTVADSVRAARRVVCAILHSPIRPDEVKRQSELDTDAK